MRKPFGNLAFAVCSTGVSISFTLRPLTSLESLSLLDWMETQQMSSIGEHSQLTELPSSVWTVRSSERVNRALIRTSPFHSHYKDQRMQTCGHLQRSLQTAAWDVLRGSRRSAFQFDLCWIRYQSCLKPHHLAKMFQMIFSHSLSAAHLSLPSDHPRTNLQK